MRVAVGFRLSAFRRKELRGVLKIGLKELTSLSSVAYGDTPFQRKGVLEVRHAAFVTQRGST